MKKIVYRLEENICKSRIQQKLVTNPKHCLKNPSSPIWKWILRKLMWISQSFHHPHRILYFLSSCLWGKRAHSSPLPFRWLQRVPFRPVQWWKHHWSCTEEDWESAVQKTETKKTTRTYEMEWQVEDWRVPLKSFYGSWPVAERAPCSEQTGLQLNRLDEGQVGCFWDYHSCWEWS